MKLVVIGCGSIGQRHIQNLYSLGARDISVFDVDKSKLEKIRKISKEIRVSPDLDILLKERLSAAIIALPTSLHTPFALKAAQSNCHLFIEKPLSHSLSGLKELQRIVKTKRLVTFVGYNFRFHPSLVKLKGILSKKYYRQDHERPDGFRFFSSRAPSGRRLPPRLRCQTFDGRRSYSGYAEPPCGLSFFFTGRAQISVLLRG